MNMKIEDLYTEEWTKKNLAEFMLICGMFVLRNFMSYFFL
jgi:hypothetical protein